MRSLIARGSLVAMTVAACGPPPRPQAEAGPAHSPPHGHGHPHSEGHGHGHGHAHAPLVHRFEHAEQWAREFNDPARDAWQMPKVVVDAMELREGMTIADIGAGTGYFEPWLSRAAGPSGTVLALDVEPDMVRYLNERVAREHLENVRPGLVALHDPKLQADSLDRVLVVDTWHHIPDREAYAATLRSALKPDGKVFIVDFKLDATHGPPPHHRLSAEQVARELIAGGLVAHVAPIRLPEQYIVVGKRQ
jgi:SAM-dependent methyltransferase